MTHEYDKAAMIDREKTPEVYTGKFIGRLGDLGLGNPNGIPSRYAETSDEALQDIAEKEAEKLVSPTDLAATACIDGRKKLRNADGSASEIRLRRAGGSSSNIAVALNSEASIIDTLSSTTSLGKQVETIDDYVARATGFERSAHLGICGKANGEVDDNELIHTKSVILEATKMVLEVPAIKAYLSKGYEDELDGESLFDDELIERVRAASGKTAEFLRESGWNGQEYVDGVKKENPRGVEDLEVDHGDEQFHGHKEPWLKIIIGDKTEEIGDGFVWSLKASKEVAAAFAVGRGVQGYKQALIAEVASHIAVCDRLPSDKTPILLLSAS